MRKIAIEIITILMISLVLSLVYTLISPPAMNVFKKVFKKTRVESVMSPIDTSENSKLFCVILACPESFFEEGFRASRNDRNVEYASRFGLD